MAEVGRQRSASGFGRGSLPLLVLSAVLLVVFVAWESEPAPKYAVAWLAMGVAGSLVAAQALWAVPWLIESGASWLRRESRHPAQVRLGIVCVALAILLIPPASDSPVKAITPVWYDGPLPFLVTRPAPAYPGSGNTNVHLIGLDGTETQLTSSGKDGHAVWAPDGRTILFSSSRNADDPAAVYVMNADGSRQRRLAAFPRNSYNPAMSPDLVHVAVGRRDGLYVARLDAPKATRLTSAGFGDASKPEWSPDGRTIAFLHDNSLFEIAGSGGKPRLLWSNGEDQPEPYDVAWSRDGEEIGLNLARGWWLVLDRDGRELRRMLKAVTNSESCADGNWLPGDFAPWITATTRFLACSRLGSG